MQYRSYKSVTWVNYDFCALPKAAHIAEDFGYNCKFVLLLFCYLNLQNWIL